MKQEKYTKRSVKDIQFSEVVKWLKANADNGYYIGYYANGEPYIDAKMLCKDMKRELTNKQ